jgi:hypothetical protein
MTKPQKCHPRYEYALLSSRPYKPDTTPSPQSKSDVDSVNFILVYIKYTGTVTYAVEK